MEGTDRALPNVVVHQFCGLALPTFTASRTTRRLLQDARFSGDSLEGVASGFFSSHMPCMEDKVIMYQVDTTGGYAQRVAEVYLRQKGPSTRFQVMDNAPWEDGGNFIPLIARLALPYEVGIHSLYLVESNSVERAGLRSQIQGHEPVGQMPMDTRYVLDVRQDDDVLVFEEKQSSHGNILGRR